VTNIDQSHARIPLEENPGGGGRFFRNIGFLKIDSNPGGGGGRILGNDGPFEIGPNLGGGGSFFDTDKPRAVVMAMEHQFQGENDDAVASQPSISLLGPMQNTSARNLSQSLTWFQVCWVTP
jgi:hypothetical protein